MNAGAVHVSVMGDDTHQQLSLRGLQSAAGFLQSKIAQRIDLRYTPRLAFILDQGVKHSIEISNLLKQVLPQDEQADAGETQADSVELDGNPDQLEPEDQE